MKGYSRDVGDGAMGVPGAALGYCQALFARSGTAAAHTARVVGLLEEVQAPWARSHEMFWGYREDESTEQFVEGGVSPLRSSGRVPILITGLDAHADGDQITQIVATNPPVAAGETILARILLKGSASIQGAAALLRSLFARAVQSRDMPKWWPLFQGQLTAGQWMELKEKAAGLWQYANIAVNPFTEADVIEVVREQVTVAQFPLGRADGVRRDGTIALAPGMKISGAPDSATYSLPGFVEMLRQVPVVPTAIVLGPSMPGWDDAINQERVAAFLPVLERGCHTLWLDLPANRRAHIWGLCA